jgi:peptidoglycan/xylan/chitin deacetylase (PgdA/CDA1 family)
MKAILTYHSIDDSGSPISLPPDTFERHARWLCERHVTVLDLDALSMHPGDGGDAVAVTFDDGYLNSKQAVARLLAAGLPVTLFAVSRRVGMTNAWGGRDQTGIPTLPLLSWDDLEQLASARATIAAHTRHHPRLTTLTTDALDEELLGSRQDLQARLGTAPTHFAYPFGDVDDRVASRAGQYFTQALTTEHRRLSSSDDPLRLPRLDMYYFRQPGTLEAWGTPRFNRWVTWCRRKRAVRSSLIDIGILR